jgi:ribonuclease D
VNYEHIITEQQLEDFCRDLARCESIAFDTEFVSEHTYRPVLCLIQVAAGDRLAVIDPLAIGSVRSFWETITAQGHEVLAHASRIELEFCLQAVDRLPARLFDVQVAAGLVGIEYPAGYGTLVYKLLGEPSQKHETRTDWRRRPLSKRQLDYAVEDVRHLHPMRDALYARLARFGRLGWFEEEMQARLEEVRRALSHDRWRRVSGNSGLDRRSLAVVRELWEWREAEAHRRNQPARRVLRDDLIVELARRQTADPKRIRAVRGMERGDLVRRADTIAACIARALDLPDDECPTRVPREPSPQMSVLGQFLFAALSSLCRQSQLAPSLVGGPNDIRDLIAYDTANDRERRRVPQLASGWRAEFVGRLFEDLIAGKKAVRITDPKSDCPLGFED